MSSAQVFGLDVRRGNVWQEINPNSEWLIVSLDLGNNKFSMVINLLNYLSSVELKLVHKGLVIIKKQLIIHGYYCIGLKLTIQTLIKPT